MPFRLELFFFGKLNPASCLYVTFSKSQSTVSFSKIQRQCLLLRYHAHTQLLLKQICKKNKYIYIPYNFSKSWNWTFVSWLVPTRKNTNQNPPSTSALHFPFSMAASLVQAAANPKTRTFNVTMLLKLERFYTVWELIKVIL